MYGIHMKMGWMKRKAAWWNIKQRIRAFLSNVFRLRACWELCHPGVPMRRLSVDQKPSWFINAGSTGTFAKKGGC